MALPKSGKSGSNVLKLDDVRRKRARATPPKTHAPDITEDASEKAESKTKSKASGGAAPRRQHQEQSTESNSTEQPAPAATKTPVKRTRVSNRRFDKVKVERIKSEISRGVYEINFLQVADKFIEHERYS